MKTTILMVCLGNICRSPLAEGILKSKVDTKKVFVDSAGTGGYHIGNPPDKRSIAIANSYGINISQQRCRKFELNDFKTFDRIYVMDNSNYENIIALTENEEERLKVKLLLSETTNDLTEVPDPYYGGEEGFNKIYHLINDASNNIANQLNLK